MDSTHKQMWICLLSGENFFFPTVVNNFDMNVFVHAEQEKCAQYWPSKEERDMDFSDTGFMVTLVSEDVEPNYTIRLLELQNDKV